MGRKLQKFYLLMWKNWKLQIRHPIQTLIEIFAPVLFSILLVLIRSLVEPENHPDPTTFPPFNIDQFPYIDGFNITHGSIAYSPSHNVKLNSIMNTAMENLYEQYGYAWTLSPQTSAKDMEAYLTNDQIMKITLAGIQFDDDIPQGSGELPKDLRMAIRFPSELRNYGSGSFNRPTWETNILFPRYQMPGPREEFNDLGGRPGYFIEGFLALQHFLSYQIISQLGGVSIEELPQVAMNRYPYPDYVSDPLLTALQSFVALIILLSFVYTCINTVRVITIEKEKQLKEAMKIMGLPNWLHWLAWFIKTLSFVILSVAFIVVLLTVPWYPGTDHSVFTLGDPSVFFFFMIIYMFATITFCFAISVFFSKANTAAAIAGLFWFLTYFPYSFLSQSTTTLTISQKMLVCLGLNSGMSYGLQIMLMFEGTGEGIQWSNIFTPITPDDGFTLGHVIIMLLVDMLLYLCIALYVEAVFPGEYGVPQKWYFPVTKSYWFGTPAGAHVEDMPATGPQHMYEAEPLNLPAGIQIRNLRKEFGSKVAVRNLSLNMYKGQITVLLGHNGAGKTTTMSMLTGMYPPSTGTATVNGHDIRADMSGVRDSLGLCPQHNVLFDDLTVKEHLYFFGKLKGLSGNALQDDIKKYIQLLELVPKTNSLSKTLSGGMKRKLSVGVALCGDSQVVMLDEPTAGMDPAARRALWDLLQRQKSGKTILLTTHFMDEADLLGDRIAIMAGGKLQCCGSSFFLKKRYGAGYHLIMEKLQNCDTAKVTEILQKYIPSIYIENNVGSELTYILPADNLPIFEQMLQDLERNSGSLGISSFGISLTTLEEVFMKVGADHGQEEANEKLENGNGDFFDKNVADDHSQDTNGRTMNFENHSSETKLDVAKTSLLIGTSLWINQFKAMLIKRVLTIWRSWILLVIQIAIPVIFMILAVVAARSSQNVKDLNKLDITLDSYNNPVTVMSADAFANNSYYETYKNTVLATGHSSLDFGTKNMTIALLNATSENVAGVRLRYIVGASFHENNTITAWFNNEPYHSPPLALNMLHNTILHQILDDDSYNIHVSNYPLPFTLESKINQLETGGSMGFQLAFNIGFAMAIVSSFYVLFYIRERMSKAKHLQFVSGVQVYTFWGASFLCDLVTFIFTSLCLLVTLAVFQEDGFSSFEDLGRLFSCFLYFGWSMLPMMYCASYFFSVPSTGFSRMVMINIFTGVAAFLVIQVLATPGLDLEYVADPLHWVFLLIPHYSMSSGVSDLNTIYATHKLCVDVCELTSPNDTNVCLKALCIFQQRCCDMSESYYAWPQPGIGRNVVFSLCIGCVLMGILISVEFGIPQKIMYLMKKTDVKHTIPEDGDDEDVAKEKLLIRNATKETLTNYSLVLKDVTKFYRSFLAVDRLNVGVKRGECFGLLGINGAGKTTTFKMLTGDEEISFGEAYVHGTSLKEDLKKVHKIIGYCPQFDALLDDLTGRETMSMFCLLRGITSADKGFVIEKLAKDFDFARHLDKKVKEYSGGNKRKLSTAIALIGDPAVVYLDEPTTGMDPAAKRHLWNALCKVRDSGRCIILTSHSMEECEALCTRLAIMVNGNFKCLGSTQHLKSKFSEGYTLTIKIKRDVDSIYVTESEIAPIHNFVMQNFPAAVLRENYQELLSYYIVDKSLPWSRMFGIMEAGKRELNIEDYSLGQASLEQVFLTFTKYQRITE